MEGKNYFAHGGRELVIGGKLTFLPGAVVEGADGLFDVETEVALEYDAPTLADSDAASVAALREDYNRLLSVLRSAGILADPADAAIPSEESHAPVG